MKRSFFAGIVILVLITGSFISCKPGMSPEEQLILDRKLIDAVKNHDQEMVKALIKSGAQVRSENSKGYTALQVAAMECEPEIGEILISEGIGPKEEIMVRAFHIAVQKCGVEMVEMLIQHIGDINVLDSVQYTPLHRACIGGRLPVVRCLVENGASVHHVEGATANTPLHRAVDEGHYDIAEYLIEKGADVNAMGVLGTPLHAAAFTCDVKIAKLLLDHGANVNISRDTNDTSWTPMRVCSDSTRTGTLYRSKRQIADMMDLLKSYGGH